MRIAVLVKEVPDTYGARKLDLETGLTDRAAGERVLDEVGERALEFAISIAESTQDTEVVAVSLGPESAVTSLRKALAMGAHRVLQLADADLAGADLTLTATALAAALRTLEPDLIVAGNVSTDGSAGIVPTMVAEHLGLPCATALDTVELVAGDGAGTIRAERTVDGAKLGVELALPAVISLTERMPDPRFASLKGIMAAKKKPFDTVSLAELGVAADELVPRSIMTAVAERPPRGAGAKLEDDGSAAAQLADFLAQKGLL
jgi:electron transfer flavoprotein beta subunit